MEPFYQFLPQNRIFAKIPLDGFLLCVLHTTYIPHNQSNSCKVTWQVHFIQLDQRIPSTIIEKGGLNKGQLLCFRKKFTISFSRIPNNQTKLSQSVMSIWSS